VREIGDIDELTELTGGDLLCRWVAQDFDGGTRAWTTDDGAATVVARAGLATKDRMAVYGAGPAAVALVGLALMEVGPTFRPLGDDKLIAKLISMINLPDGRRLEKVADFGWMDRTESLGEEPSAGDAQWLTDEEQPEIAELLALAFPDSDARPGGPGVERWAGIRDESGRLAAVSALGWSAPTVGYLVGVAVRPELRGQGLGERVCRLAIGEAIRERGAVALMVDGDNEPAIKLYRRLGLSYRPLLAAHLPPPA
jgi:ribosomal protein S18 acetylase RimI-like enzyme